MIFMTRSQRERLALGIFALTLGAIVASCMVFRDPLGFVFGMVDIAIGAGLLATVPN